MAVVRRAISHPPEVVFRALVDPYTYPHWLVGCREIREVDEGWPAVESLFHHRVGLVGPIAIADHTKSLHIEAHRQVHLEVRFRPIGRGRVSFMLDPLPEGSAESTMVRFTEVPIGLLSVVKPALDPLTTYRNRISLANLSRYLDER